MGAPKGLSQNNDHSTCTHTTEREGSNITEQECLSKNIELEECPKTPELENLGLIETETRPSRVLVCMEWWTDTHPVVERVINWLQNKAWVGHLYVLTCPEVIYGRGTSPSVRAQVERELDRVSRLCTLANVPHTLLIKNGSPSVAMHVVIQKYHIDMVVLGRRNVSQLDRVLLGSVSDEAVKHAKCSVTVVKPKPSPQQQGEEGVMVALDLSETSKNAFQVGLSMAKKHTKLTLATVCPSKKPAVQQQYKDALESYCKQAEAAGVEVHSVFLRSKNAGEALVAEVKKHDVDVLVLNKTTHNSTRSLFAGSASTYAVNHSPSSVILVK